MPFQFTHCLFFISSAFLFSWSFTGFAFSYQSISFFILRKFFLPFVLTASANISFIISIIYNPAYCLLCVMLCLQFSSCVHCFSCILYFSVKAFTLFTHLILDLQVLFFLRTFTFVFHFYRDECALSVDSCFSPITVLIRLSLNQFWLRSFLQETFILPHVVVL